MDWKREAAQELKSYPLRLAAEQALAEELQELEEQLLALPGGGGRPGGTLAGGKTGRAGERLAALLDERGRKADNLQLTRRQLARTRRGLAALNARQRELLDRFYIHRTPGHAVSLAAEWHLEQSRLYQLKDEALRDFTLARYGLLES